MTRPAPEETMTCGIEFVKWFWTGPWLVTCRRRAGHDGEHCNIPGALSP